MKVSTRNPIRRGLSLSLIALVTVVVLTSCARKCANGEGYCGQRMLGNADSVPTSGAGFAPRTYYLRESGFTCQDTAGNTLSSHKDAIEYDGRQFVSTGTICDSQAITLDSSEVYLSADGKSLYYAGEHYKLPE